MPLAIGPQKKGLQGCNNTVLLPSASCAKDLDGLAILFVTNAPKLEKVGCRSSWLSPCPPPILLRKVVLQLHALWPESGGVGSTYLKAAHGFPHLQPVNEFSSEHRMKADSIELSYLLRHNVDPNRYSKMLCSDKTYQNLGRPAYDLPVTPLA